MNGGCCAEDSSPSWRVYLSSPYSLQSSPSDGGNDCDCQLTSAYGGEFELTSTSISGPSVCVVLIERALSSPSDSIFGKCFWRPRSETVFLAQVTLNVLVGTASRKG